MKPLDPKSTDYVPTNTENATLPPKIFAAEMAAIRARRKNYTIPFADDGNTSIEPNVGTGLVGLSLSGGGIRSSTFNLGVLQSLEQAGFLPHVDYLSTVSGGGYIGSCLSSYWSGSQPSSFDYIEITGVPQECNIPHGQNLGGGRWRYAAKTGDQLILHFPASEIPRKYNTILSAKGMTPAEIASAEPTATPIPLYFKKASTTLDTLSIEEAKQDTTRSLIITGKCDEELSIVIQLGVCHDFPFHHESGQLETQSFRHLRECANYLKPPSPFAGLRLPGLFLRGLLINALIVLPLLLFLTVFTVLFVKDDMHDALNTTSLTYLINSNELKQNRKAKELPPGDYQYTSIDLTPHISWSSHTQDIDILLTGVPDGAAIFPADNLKDTGSLKARNLGEGVWLIQHKNPMQINFLLSLPVKFNSPLQVTAWETNNHFKWLDTVWSYRIRAHFPQIFDAWQATVSPLLKNGANAPSEAIPQSSEKRYIYSLDLTEQLNWQKYIVLAGVPANSYSNEGKFLSDGRWLFTGKTAADLQLSLYVPDLQVDFLTQVTAWESVHHDKFNTLKQRTKKRANVTLTGDRFEIQSWIAGDRENISKNSLTPDDLKGTESVTKLMQAMGLNGPTDTEKMYFRITYLPQEDALKGDALKENRPLVEQLSQKNGGWIFIDDGVQELLAHLENLLTSKQHDGASFQVTAWCSGADADVLDPVTQLYRNTFRITKWVVLFFALFLAFYPLLQYFFRLTGFQPWRMRDLLTRYVCGAGIAIVVGCAFVEMQPLAIYLFQRFKETITLTAMIGGADKGLAIFGSLLAAGGGLFAANSIGRGAKLSARISLYVMGVIGPTVLWLFYLNFCLWALANENIPEMFRNTEGYVIWVYLIVGLVTYLISRQYYNVNQTSIHPFYRDRLSATFLITEDQQTGELVHNDNQKLHLLDSRCAPYHIINATLNLTGRSKVNLKGRKAEFFTFTRDYVGSRVTGYARTKRYEEMDEQMGLGTAMAISAAAAAPNMGRETNRSMTFIMALLNIRLGYWANNPLILSSKMGRKWWYILKDRFCRNQVGPIFLLREMLGLVNERSRFVNLSDGGHLENMGLYELVRRRCKYIIVCDAEADKNMTCHGLADAIRMILIDMGIQIHIDLNSIYRKKKHADGTLEILGNAHYAVGTIEYGSGPDEQGYLLYIKSSVSGKHVSYIEDYMARNPDFPHETTADQFFDEAQFEAYRALGCEIGDETLEALIALADRHKKTQSSGNGIKTRWAEQAGRKWGTLLRAAQGKQSNNKSNLPDQDSGLNH